MELTGQIDEQGVATVFNRAQLEQWFLDNKGKQFTLKIERRIRKRSTPQNRYYYGIVIPLVRDAMNSYGNEMTLESTHEYLKKEFNWVEMETRPGYYVKVPQSTTKLSTADFMVYLDKIYVFASEVLGIVIPQPNQQLSIDTHITLHDPSLPNVTIHDKTNI